MLDRPRNVGLGRVAVRRNQARDEPQLVSAVIPCYGQAHYLSEAIESVRSQTYSEIEVVVGMIASGSPGAVHEKSTGGKALRKARLAACRH